MPFKARLQNATGIPVLSLEPLGGGDTARAFRMVTPHGLRFLKTLDGGTAYTGLRAEAEGLQALGSAGVLRTPEVDGVYPLENGACLVMEWIPSRPGSPEECRAFGANLARMHLQKAPAFGWDSDNFLGRLPQKNPREADWVAFYVHHRLMPQYRMAIAAGLMAQSEIPTAEELCQKMAEHTPEVFPSLLHGDLWGGNFLIAENGDAVLIDPAVYRGHAEVDLAMSRLFGGFPEAFYDGYYALAPQQEGWEVRQQWYQLYYLLAHLNLFGNSYLPAVLRLRRELF